jgi:hypothetical protein
MHTKGPWKYATNVGPTKALIVETDGSTILELEATVGKRSDLEANARLIAAAPELLAALKRIARSFPEAIAIARDAVNKAEPTWR